MKQENSIPVINSSEPKGLKVAVRINTLSFVILNYVTSQVSPAIAIVRYMLLLRSGEFSLVFFNYNM
jgi:hypothetical protein